MKVLIYGAGVIGMLYSGKPEEVVGHKATVVARGQRLGGRGRSRKRGARSPSLASAKLIERAAWRRLRLNCTAGSWRRQGFAVVCWRKQSGANRSSPHAGQAGVVSRVPRRGRVSTSQTIELCLECHCYATVLLLAQLHSGKLE